MAPKANKASAQAVRDRFDKLGIFYSETWGDWSKGDRVGIVDEAGVYHIQGFRENSEGTVVSVVGGPVYGQEQTREFRTFDAERLTTKIVMRSKKAPREDGEE